MDARETRHTDWIVNGDLTYRIWQEFDGVRWFQRHEWKNADGSTRMDDWIRGAAGWCPGSEEVGLSHITMEGNAVEAKLQRAMKLMRTA